MRDTRTRDSSQKIHYVVLHSLAYKLLYLAKRCRPDLLPAAQFFTTRVSISTEQDVGKAFHTLKRINHTRALELRLSATQPLAILCYIDSAHAVHPNKKSQSGSCIGLGVGSVHWSTSGIKMNTKSSAESEFYELQECNRQQKMKILLMDFCLH